MIIIDKLQFQNVVKEGFPGPGDWFKICVLSTSIFYCARCNHSMIAHDCITHHCHTCATIALCCSTSRLCSEFKLNNSEITP